jgi:hypothetical protein
MKKFSPATNKAIGYYVYLLVDPRDNTIFYVGKGKANRVFMHEKYANSLSSPKDQRICSIIAGGQEVKKYIIRLGLSNEEAYIVESVVINLLGTSEHGDINTSVSLTNIQCGHGMKKNGMMLVEEVEKLYSAKPLTQRMIKHNLLCVNINHLYSAKTDLYEATRKSWVISKKNADRCDFVASEYQGIIRALYKVNGEWYHVEGTDKNRFQFDGEPVEDPEILKLYLNKKIEKGANGKRPSRNPVRYIMKKANNNKTK